METTNGGLIAFHSDLLALQKELRPVPMDSNNPYFNSKYASLTAVIDHVKPQLTKHNFFMTQLLNGASLETKLIHISGKELSSSYPLHPDLSNAQKFGANLSYARRYALMAILGLATEDDDGNTTSSGRAIPKDTVSVPIQEQEERPTFTTITKPVVNGGDFTMPFGSNKGKMASECPTADITFAMSVFKKSLMDPKKSQFKENNERNLRTAESILANRRKSEELPF